MPETPLLAVRCPIDVLDQIESEKNLTGRSKTDVVIDRLRSSIPSLAVTDRHKLPAIAAIYQVFTSDNNLLYIGITDNLKQDWESHPLYGQFLESDVNSRITWYNSDLPVIDPNLVKKYNSVSDTVNTDRDSHSENMVSSDQLEYAIANSEIIKGIQSKLDDMERLLRLQREASIATSPIVEPTGETSHDEPDRPAIGTVTPEVSPSPPDQPAIGTLPTVETADTVETDTEKVEAVTDTVEAVTVKVESVYTVETLTSEPDSSIEPVTDAIGPVPGDSPQFNNQLSEGMNPNQAHDYLKKRGIEDTSYYYLNKWAKAGVIDTWHGKTAQKHLILRHGLYYPNPDQP